MLEYMSFDVGIGLDSCIIPLRRHDLYLVQSTDFFYPLIDDPFWMGKITCANVTSDVFATGVTKLDSLNVIISVPSQMTPKQRDVVMPLIIKGFAENAKLCNVEVKFEKLFNNPWLIIGGTATGIVLQNEFIKPTSICIGDVLVLTKPIGAQIACNTKKITEDKEKWTKYEDVASLEEVEVAFKCAVKSMARMNLVAAELMHKYEAHGATDVTGFGIVGHAENLAAFQKQNVDIVIEKLPIIEHVVKFAQMTNQYERFIKGKRPETSGGLLIALRAEVAELYCREIEQIEGFPAWIIGRVEEGSKTARIVENPDIITAKLLPCTN